MGSRSKQHTRSQNCSPRLLYYDAGTVLAIVLLHASRGSGFCPVLAYTFKRDRILSMYEWQRRQKRCIVQIIHEKKCTILCIHKKGMIQIIHGKMYDFGRTHKRCRIFLKHFLLCKSWRLEYILRIVHNAFTQQRFLLLLFMAVSEFIKSWGWLITSRDAKGFKCCGTTTVYVSRLKSS